MCLQRLAAVRPQTVAGVFWKNFRYIHEVVEVPAAAQADFGYQIRSQTVANRRNSFQNRTTVLPLLVRIFAVVKSCFSNFLRHFSLRTSETNYLNEAYSFYAAIRGRAYYSRAAKEDR